MARNYYDGWTEAELLREKKIVQRQLSQGRITEIRIAGEQTRNEDRQSTPLEVTLDRIDYALYLLCAAGQTGTNVYENPYQRETGVTLQRFG